jgi:hypothetical protein
MASRLDRLTKSTAVALSRRGFLKRVPLVGAVVGLGLAASAAPAYACGDSWSEARTLYGNCNSCGPQMKLVTFQSRTCKVCGSGTVCTSWTAYATVCAANLC